MSSFIRTNPDIHIERLESYFSYYSSDESSREESTSNSESLQVLRNNDRRLRLPLISDFCSSTSEISTYLQHVKLNQVNSLGVPIPPLLPFEIQHKMEPYRILKDQRAMGVDSQALSNLEGAYASVSEAIELLDVPREAHGDKNTELELYSHFVYFLTLPLEDAVLKQMIRSYILKHNSNGFLIGEKFEFSDCVDGSFAFVLQTLWLAAIVRKTKMDGTNIELSQGLLEESSCDVCFQTKLMICRTCCAYNICSECLATYVASRITEEPDNFTVECPKCRKFLTVDEIRFRLKYSLYPEALKLFEKRLKEALVKNDSYLCSNCSALIGNSKLGLKNQKECWNCGHLTCSRCKSPWHSGISCKRYKQGDIEMKKWAKGTSISTRQATKCPGCRRWYQKTSGCDHMFCNRCNTDFCYSCGGKFRSFFILGSHGTKLSVLGCKNNFLKDHPVLRKTVRGSILGGAVIVTPIVAPIAAIGACGVGVVWVGARVVRKIIRTTF